MPKNHKPCPTLNSEKLAGEITRVHLDDVAKAFGLVADALNRARDQWIPRQAVFEALVHTLAGLGCEGQTSEQAAIALEAAAHQLRNDSNPRLSS
jgi:hypothetical protein